MRIQDRIGRDVHAAARTCCCFLALLGASHGAFAVSAEGDETRIAASREPAVAAASTGSCSEHLRAFHGQTPQQIDGALKSEFQDYLPLIEQSLAYRAESIKLAKRLKDKSTHNEPLSADDLDRLNLGTLAHISLRKKLYALAEAHECWLDDSGAGLTKSTLAPAARLKGVMMSLSAALVLYDNYLLAISIFEEDAKLRRFLNERDTGYAKGSAELAKITLSYNSIGNRQRVRNAMHYYEREIGRMPGAFLEQEDVAYLKLLISQSPSYEMTKRYSPMRAIGHKLDFLSAMTGDTLKSLSAEGVNLFSMVFGNSIGLVEARKGKLYNRPELLKEVAGQLTAGDILLEKTPFRLSDKFIPGHWGHAAVWIGDEEDLKALGIWNHPLVVKHHDAIRAGRSIVEALRSGVEMNGLAHFMNVDDLAVLRKKDMSLSERAEAVLLALRQVGKAYDFNFDVETTDRIVCSELVYMTFKDIRWPTAKTLGRATISPDNIAVKALDDGPLDLILFCHNGNEIADRRLTLMRQLMGKDAPKQDVANMSVAPRFGPAE